jgi:hypothetical protein
LAVNRTPINTFDFSWIYIEPGYTVDPTTKDIVNPGTQFYKIEYAIGSSSDSDVGNLSWTCIDLGDTDPSLPTVYTKQFTGWKFLFKGVHLAPTVTTAQLQGNIFFRVLVGPTVTGPFTKGVIRPANGQTGIWSTVDFVTDWPEVGEVRMAPFCLEP